MTPRIRILFVSLATLPLTLLAAPDAAPRDPPGWHLVWNDEFDGAAVDESKWHVEDAGLVKNNELQYYTPDDVAIEKGCLVLRAERRSLGDRNFTSGLVDSKGRFTMQFGRVEFRARAPKGQGLWPAVWMLRADGKWPPEIDIFEMVGSQPNAVTMTLHYGSWPDHEWDTETHIDAKADYSADFHTYALEWEPDALRWFIDGVMRYQTQGNIPNKPFYLIINLAVGGDMPGDPDETTVFPATMFVDYIRAYGKEEPGTFFLTTSAANGRIATPTWKPRYAKGEVVTLKAAPFIGYKFSGWSGDASGKDPELKVTMDRHRNIAANFVPDPDAPPLISGGKPAKASSVENDDDELGAGNVTDGKRSSRWSSKFSDKEWLQVDLGAAYAIQAVRLDWENAYGRAYDVQVSDDGKQWKTVYTQADWKGGVDEFYVHATGRYVRLAGKQRGTEWGWSLFEFGVYGKKM